MIVASAHLADAAKNISFESSAEVLTCIFMQAISSSGSLRTRQEDTGV
jgi:hypothetical protein